MVSFRRYLWLSQYYVVVTVYLCISRPDEKIETNISSDIKICAKKTIEMHFQTQDNKC